MPIHTDLKTDYDRRFTELNAHFIRAVADHCRADSFLPDQSLLLNTVVALALENTNTPVAISVQGEVTLL